MVEFRAAKTKDMVSLAPRLRKADVEEVLAYSGHDAFTALLLSFGDSKRTWVAEIGGQVECVFGIAEVTHKIGCPWMLGTDVIHRHSKRLVADAKLIVEDMNAAYPLLANMVHAKNTAAIRWLKHLGFQFSDGVEHGPNKELFYPFYRHNTCAFQ